MKREKCLKKSVFFFYLLKLTWEVITNISCSDDKILTPWRDMMVLLIVKSNKQVYAEPDSLYWSLHLFSWSGFLPLWLYIFSFICVVLQIRQEYLVLHFHALVDVVLLSNTMIEWFFVLFYFLSPFFFLYLFSIHVASFST